MVMYAGRRLVLVIAPALWLVACGSDATRVSSADKAAPAPVIQSEPVNASSEVWAGTWNLNLAKSSYEAGPPPRSGVSRLAPAGDGWEGSQDVIDPEGHPSHVDLRFKFDGHDYVVNGAPNTTWAFTKVDNFTYDLLVKHNGEVSAMARTVVSPDLNTRTTTAKSTAPDGRTLTNVAVYDRADTK